MKASPEEPEGAVPCAQGSGIALAEALWTVRECARFLGRSPRWVWAALRRRPDDAGSIPHVRIGKSPRFFPDDIAAWARQGCPPAAMLAQWQEAQKKRGK